MLLQESEGIKDHFGFTSLAHQRILKEKEERAEGENKALLAFDYDFIRMFTPGSDSSFWGDLHKWEVVEFFVLLKAAEAMFSDAICENESSIR